MLEVGRSSKEDSCSLPRIAGILVGLGVPVRNACEMEMSDKELQRQRTLSDAGRAGKDETGRRSAAG